jgi:hypothetical protein
MPLRIGTVFCSSVRWLEAREPLKLFSVSVISAQHRIAPLARLILDKDEAPELVGDQSA